MSSNNRETKKYYILNNDKTTFLIIRDDIIDKNIDMENKEINKDNLTLVFDLENLNLALTPSEVVRIIEKTKPKNIIIKNSRIDKIDNMYYKDKLLYLNELFISDELYSMSGHLKSLYNTFRPKKLTLKQFKINSKSQLHNFLEFIKEVGCEELILEDIFIELLIKQNEEDQTYNVLEEYIGVNNGIIVIFNDNEENKFELKKLKTLKMIDCPLFAITEGTFIDINKDISIDIDENSLINPSILTKFKIKEGFSYLCFDFDSCMLNEEITDNKIKNYKKVLDSYILNEKNIDIKIANYIYVFDMILDAKNHKFKKLVFKNFDITKYEYITGENLTFIDEQNWIFNEEEERKRKEIFEAFDKDRDNIINNNKDKLKDVKELVFDNCSNYFIEKILKFTDSSKNDLDLLKIKKCGKEYFDLKNILSLNIKHLILFDTPLIVDHSNKNNDGNNDNDNLSNFNGKFGIYEQLTIKIMSLEHYCTVSNLDYYKTIKIIVELIQRENFIKKICFESNALPIIMTFLITKPYYDGYLKEIPNETTTDNNKGNNEEASKVTKNEKNNEKNDGQNNSENKIQRKKYIISPYYDFNEIFEEKEKAPQRKTKNKNGVAWRDRLIDAFFNININNKEIIIKKNNIKNKFENYDYLLEELLKDVPEEIKDGNNNKEPTKKEEKYKILEKIEGKNNFGSDIFNVDIDYRRFFKLNKIKNVVFEKCLFSHYVQNPKYSNFKLNIKETIINLIKDEKVINYIIDMKTINEIIFKNKNIEDLSSLCKYLAIKKSKGSLVNSQDNNDY